MGQNICQSGGFGIVEGLHMDPWRWVDEEFRQPLLINVPAKGIKIA